MKLQIIKIPIFLFLYVVLSIPLVFAKTNIEEFLTDIELKHRYSGIHRIDCVYVINLEQRFQKWEEMKGLFQSYGIYPNRVNAINGWMLSEEDKQTLMGPYPLRLRGGQIGCILSHLSCIQHALNKGYKMVWICEDDIEICENPHQLSDLMNQLSKIDPKWDVLYTDSDSKNNQGVTVPSISSDFRPNFLHKSLDYYRDQKKMDRNFIKKNQRFGSYSYIITRRGMEKIFDHFLNNYLWTAYDVDMHYVSKIREYCMTRDLVSINWKTPSDTE